MKRIIAFAALLVLGVSGFAQTSKNSSQQSRREHEWDSIKVEKVGFITSKLDLTVEEAQAFWPVYNKYEKDMAAANREVHRTMRNLRPKEGENLSEAEMLQRLNAYVAAKAKVSDVTAQYNKEFLKVLPAAKVAGLYVAEEQFTRKILDGFAQRRYCSSASGRKENPQKAR